MSYAEIISQAATKHAVAPQAEPTTTATENAYRRLIMPVDGNGPGIIVDVYEVLAAFGVTCPALAHAIKKLLCAGERGVKDTDQDLREAVIAIQAARRRVKNEAKRKATK